MAPLTLKKSESLKQRFRHIFSERIPQAVLTGTRKLNPTARACKTWITTNGFDGRRVRRKEIRIG